MTHSTPMNSFLYALPSIILVGSANVILKWRTDWLNKLNVGPFGKEALRFIFDPYILVGIFATAASILWWLKIMPEVKVSVVYPIIQAGVIGMTILLSFIFLHERLNLGQSLGLVLLVAGVIIASWSS